MKEVAHNIESGTVKQILDNKTKCNLREHAYILEKYNTSCLLASDIQVRNILRPFDKEQIACKSVRTGPPSLS